jgi:hypothetical protein
MNQSHRYFDVASILDQSPFFGECQILRPHKKRLYMVKQRTSSEFNEKNELQSIYWADH